jgi:hypothetical protein
MLGAAAWFYNLSGWIYRVRAVWDDGKPPRRASDREQTCTWTWATPGQLHVIVCTVYEIGVAIPVIATEYVLFGWVVQPIGRKLIAYLEP